MSCGRQGATRVTHPACWWTSSPASWPSFPRGPASTECSGRWRQCRLRQHPPTIPVMILVLECTECSRKYTIHCTPSALPMLVLILRVLSFCCYDQCKNMCGNLSGAAFRNGPIPPLDSVPRVPLEQNYIHHLKQTTKNRNRIH